MWSIQNRHSKPHTFKRVLPRILQHFVVKGKILKGNEQVSTVVSNIITVPLKEKILEHGILRNTLIDNASVLLLKILGCFVFDK